MRGENPQDTLRYFMRGQKPLLTGAGAVPLAAGAMRGGPTEAAPAEY
jgi:hypothetical protein